MGRYRSPCGSSHRAIPWPSELLGRLDVVIPGPTGVVPTGGRIRKLGVVKHFRVVVDVRAGGQAWATADLALALVDLKHRGDEEASVEAVALDQGCEVGEQTT